MYLSYPSFIKISIIQKHKVSTWRNFRNFKNFQNLLGCKYFLYLKFKVSLKSEGYLQILMFLSYSNPLTNNTKIYINVCLICLQYYILCILSIYEFINVYMFYFVLPISIFIQKFLTVLLVETFYTVSKKSSLCILHGMHIGSLV